APAKYPTKPSSYGTGYK
nr:adhesive polyphenolic protein [Septifer bifurcatus=marine mussels, Peptide Partial, 17 aa] [Mytilisepta bifurcata]